VWWAEGSSAVGMVALAPLVIAVAASRRLPRLLAAERIAGLIEHEQSLHHSLVPQFLSGQPLNQAYWTELAQTSRRNYLDLLRRTERTAEDGARIIVWAEGSGVVLQDDLGWARIVLLETVQRTDAHVVATLAVLDPETRHLSNTALIVTPQGTVAHHYTKAHTLPGTETERTLPGDSTVAAVETPLGRLAVVICFDADHPDVWRSIRDARAEIVAIPASDWPAIADLHADMARIRARSAGAALIRPARFGRSVVTDRQGRLLAVVDHTRRADPDLVADLPSVRAGNSTPWRSTTAHSHHHTTEDP